MSFQECMNELKEKAKDREIEIDQYYNKILFLDVREEMKRHHRGSRTRPSQIKAKNRYGLLYNYFYKFFI